ncbi:hypothetical protein [uncultured Gammaproteobacteria bacterium]|nr:hypothetical protein [uncultured Gammaproteobacteria bacterium]
MNLTVFALTGLLLLVFYTFFKNITFKKAMGNYTKTLLKIRDLEGFNPDFINFLHAVNQRSVSNLFLPKVFFLGLLFKKQGEEALKKLSKEELDVYIDICIEALKNYLYYAPHWAGIISLIGIIVLPFIALFSSLEKLKLFIKPIELSLIKH